MNNLYWKWFITTMDKRLKYFYKH